VQALIAAGTNVHAANTAGYTAVMVRRRLCCCCRFANLLADPLASACQNAAQGGFPTICTVLAAAGANLEAALPGGGPHSAAPQRGSGSTALVLAAGNAMKQGDEQCKLTVQALLAAGANLDARSDMSAPAFAYAYEILGEDSATAAALAKAAGLSVEEYCQKLATENEGRMRLGDDGQFDCCSACGGAKAESEFSKKQRKRESGKRTCKVCVQQQQQHKQQQQKQQKQQQHSASSDFQTGEHVFGLYSQNGEWYPAQVVEVREAGSNLPPTFLLDWADDDPTDRVKTLEQLRSRSRFETRTGHLSESESESE